MTRGASSVFVVMEVMVVVVDEGVARAVAVEDSPCSAEGVKVVAAAAEDSCSCSCS